MSLGDRWTSFFNKIKQHRIKFSLRWIIYTFVALGVLGLSGFVLIKVTHATYLLSPGKLSAYHEKDDLLGGVSSHAELQRQCAHCHAPVHCVEDTRCQDCHFDIAADRNDVTTLHGRLPGVSKCQNCHPEHNGSEADLTLLPFLNVDHYLLAGFSLAHHVDNYDGNKFSCTSCHTQEGSILETMDCVDCHAAEDHDYIATHIEAYGSACIECHDGRDRMIEEFDHEPFFSLQAGHSEVDCSDCHQKEQYVGLTSTCEDCHVEPEIHAGVFGTNCERCHSATAWVPAQLKEHTFAIQHGSEPVQDCETCHAGTYTEYPCGSCHEDAAMNDVHKSLRAADLSDCIACHPTGRGKEMVIQEDPGNNAYGMMKNDFDGAPAQFQGESPGPGAEKH